MHSLQHFKIKSEYGLISWTRRDIKHLRDFKHLWNVTARLILLQAYLKLLAAVATLNLKDSTKQLHHPYYATNIHTDVNLS